MGKEDLANSFVREVSRNVNRRTQDGEKMPLLCGQCERKFSRWEGDFASKVFVPLHDGQRGPFAYGPWALKFAASVSWRVLITVLQRLTDLTGEQRSAAEVALVGVERIPARHATNTWTS